MKMRPPEFGAPETAAEILEREGLNKKPDETVTETLLRFPKKLNRALELNLPDSPGKELRRSYQQRGLRQLDSSF